ncbi:hypothetical protein NQZ68_035722 [Dissostichus eleginoides]|nr:hypothetical protein NQZ68_035722 [Dissostichus eleginoides]
MSDVLDEWCLSVGAITGAVVGAITGAVGKAITGAVGRAITGVVGRAVGRAITGAVVGAITGEVVGAITGAVGRAITGAVGRAITGAVVGAITGAVGRAITGAVVVVAGATANVVGSSVQHNLCPPTAAPESTEAPGSRGPSRTPSRQSSKNEQGSHLEIKPLQKFDSEEPAPDVVVLHLLPLLISQDEEEEPRPASKVPSKATTPEPKTIEVIPERAPSVQERAPSVSENKVESREARRSASRAETTALPKRQPSPAPSPKRPTTTPEPKPAPTPVEAEAIVAKPAAKVEPKAESRQKAMALSRSPEVPAESLELEGPNTIMVTTLQNCRTRVRNVQAASSRGPADKAGAAPAATAAP